MYILRFMRGMGVKSGVVGCCLPCGEIGRPSRGYKVFSWKEGAETQQSHVSWVNGSISLPDVCDGCKCASSISTYVIKGRGDRRWPRKPSSRLLTEQPKVRSTERRTDAAVARWSCGETFRRSDRKNQARDSLGRRERRRYHGSAVPLAIWVIDHVTCFIASVHVCVTVAHQFFFFIFFARTSPNSERIYLHTASQTGSMSARRCADSTLRSRCPELMLMNNRLQTSACYFT